MSLVVTHMFAASDADAPRIECGENIVVSTLAASRSNFNQRAIVLNVTGLYGLMVDKNNLDFDAHKSLVLSSYVLKVCTGHLVAWEGREKELLHWFPLPGLFGKSIWEECHTLWAVFTPLQVQLGQVRSVLKGLVPKALLFFKCQIPQR